MALYATDYKCVMATVLNLISSRSYRRGRRGGKIRQNVFFATSGNRFRSPEKIAAKDLGWHNSKNRHLESRHTRNWIMQYTVRRLGRLDNNETIARVVARNY